MDLGDIRRRHHALKGLAADLKSTFGLGRVIAGTSTAKARGAAEVAMQDVYVAARTSSNNLTRMAATLDIRIKYMLAFDKPYPSTYATVADARRAGKKLAEKYLSDPAKYYGQLKANAADPQFAAAFVKAHKGDLAGFISAASLVSREEDFSKTIGVLVGSASTAGAFKASDLGKILDLTQVPSFPDGQRLDPDEFFRGLIKGASLRPPAVRPGASTTLTVALVLHADKFYGGSPTPSDGLLNSLDLSLVRNGKEIFTLLSSRKDLGAVAGLNGNAVKQAIAVLLSGDNHISASKSEFVKAVGAVAAEQVRERTNIVQVANFDDAVQEFDQEFRDLERVLATIDSAVGARQVDQAADADALRNTLRQAAFNAALAGLAIVAPPVLGPALGAGSAISLATTANTDAAVARANLTAASANLSRELVFAVTKLNYLKSIKAPAAFWPDGFSQVFRYDQHSKTYVLKDGVAADSEKLHAVLNQDELDLN